MEHVDRVADVEALPLPHWRRGARAHDDPGLVVEHFHNACGIRQHLRRARDVRHDATIRTAKAKLTIGLSIDLITLLVDGAVMAAAEQYEVRECRRATLGPMSDVVGLAEVPVATREAAAAVAMQ
jgi:hypothetical protein